jgi:hypothetical protein
MGILPNQHKSTTLYYDIYQTLMPNKLPKSKTITMKKKLNSILHCLASKAPLLIQLPSKLHNAYCPNTMQHTINIKNKETLITVKSNQSQRLQ